MYSKMEKMLKYININMFTGRLKVPEANPKVLIVTSTNVMGVNHPNLQVVLQCKILEDISMVVQCQGRSSRCGKEIVFLLAAGFLSYLNLVYQFDG